MFKKGRQAARVAVTLTVLAAAAVAGVVIWRHYLAAPWTRDGQVLAYVANLAPDVSGRILAVPLHASATVRGMGTLSTRFLVRVISFQDWLHNVRLNHRLITYSSKFYLARHLTLGAATMIEHSMVEVNGAHIHVAMTGQGRPLLLLHGWPEFWFTWEPVMQRLADRFRLIAPDLRGFGDSDKPSFPFGPDDQAADLSVLIEKLGIAPVGIVAHDVGGSVAQALARRSPRQIAGLFLFNFVYPGIGDRFNKPDHLRYVWHTYFNQSELAPKLLGISPDAVRLFITYFLHLWAHRKEAFDLPTIDAFVENFQKPGNLEGGFTYYRSVAAQRAKEAERHEQPPPIHLPTCVRWTECDPALPIAWTDRLGEFFTDLDFVPFPDAGHFPHHEQPGRAAQEIADFFGKIEQRGWPT